MKRMLIFILCTLNLLLANNQAVADNLKFIQVTDVHLTQANKSYLESFAKDINEKYNDMDFIIFTGDNIDRPNIEDLKSFLKIIKTIKLKKYVIIGNHDVCKLKHLDKQTYMGLVKKELGHYHSSKTYYVFKKKDIVFVVMDGVREVIPGPHGYFKEEELQWLDKTLSKYKNKKVVLIQHFPFMTAHSRTHEIYRKEDYLSVLQKHDNVIAVISGHYHENREMQQDNIYHVVTRNFADNTYYKIIEIDTKTPKVYTTLIDNSGS